MSLKSQSLKVCTKLKYFFVDKQSKELYYLSHRKATSDSKKRISVIRVKKETR